MSAATSIDEVAVLIGDICGTHSGRRRTSTIPESGRVLRRKPTANSTALMASSTSSVPPPAAAAIATAGTSPPAGIPLATPPMTPTHSISGGSDGDKPIPSGNVITSPTDQLTVLKQQVAKLKSQLTDKKPYIVVQGLAAFLDRVCLCDATMAHETDKVESLSPPVPELFATTEPFDWPPPEYMEILLPDLPLTRTTERQHKIDSVKSFIVALVRSYNPRQEPETATLMSRTLLTILADRTTSLQLRMNASTIVGALFQCKYFAGDVCQTLYGIFSNTLGGIATAEMAVSVAAAIVASGSPLKVGSRAFEELKKLIQKSNMTKGLTAADLEKLKLRGVAHKHADPMTSLGADGQEELPFDPLAEERVEAPPATKQSESKSANAPSATAVAAADAKDLKQSRVEDDVRKQVQIGEKKNNRSEGNVAREEGVQKPGPVPKSSPTAAGGDAKPTSSSGIFNRCESTSTSEEKVTPPNSHKRNKTTPYGVGDPAPSSASEGSSSSDPPKSATSTSVLSPPHRTLPTSPATGAGASDVGGAATKPVLNMSIKEDRTRRTVYVSRMDPTLSTAALRQFLLACGQILRVRLCGDNVSRSRFGFVEFEDKDGAKAMISKNGSMLGNEIIRCGPARKPIQDNDPRDAILDSRRGLVRACLFGLQVAQEELEKFSLSRSAALSRSEHHKSMRKSQHPATSTTSRGDAPADDESAAASDNANRFFGRGPVNVKLNTDSQQQRSEGSESSSSVVEGSSSNKSGSGFVPSSSGSLSQKNASSSSVGSSMQSPSTSSATTATVATPTVAVSGSSQRNGASTNTVNKATRGSSEAGRSVTIAGRKESAESS